MSKKYSRSWKYCQLLGEVETIFMEKISINFNKIRSELFLPKLETTNRFYLFRHKTLPTTGQKLLAAMKDIFPNH